MSKLSQILHLTQRIKEQTFHLLELKSLLHFAILSLRQHAILHSRLMFILLSLPPFNSSYHISTCFMGCFLSNLHVGYFMRQICSCTLYNFYTLHNLNFIDCKYTVFLITFNNHVEQYHTPFKFKQKLRKYNVMIFNFKSE